MVLTNHHLSFRTFINSRRRFLATVVGSAVFSCLICLPWKCMCCPILPRSFQLSRGRCVVRDCMVTRDEDSRRDILRDHPSPVELLDGLVIQKKAKWAIYFSKHEEWFQSLSYSALLFPNEYATSFFYCFSLLREEILFFICASRPVNKHPHRRSFLETY